MFTTLAPTLLNSAAFIGVMGVAQDKNADRCFEVETKMLAYAAKDTPRYRRDMVMADCNI